MHPIELLEARRVPAAISVAPVQVVEANSVTQATFTATLDSASTEAVSLTYSTVNDSARAGRDYIATSSSVTIPAGSTTATFSVPILASDVSGKANEKFFVVLKTSGGNSVTSRAVAATIVDGNVAPTVSASDLTVVEPTSGSKTAAVTLSLSNPSAKAVQVSYATVDVTATSAGTSRDYQTSSGSVTIQPGATSFKIPVRVDSKATDDATFNVYLRSATNAILSTSRPDGTYSRVVIQDSASTTTKPTITVSSPFVSAGSPATFTVTLSSASTEPVSFRYSTEAATASASEFTAVDDVLTIPAGQTSATISVPTAANTTTSSSDYFVLNLSTPANATLATTTAAGTIIGTAVQPTLSVANLSSVATANTASTVDFTVSLSAASTSPVIVGYSTVDGTAVAGTGYTATSGVLVFQPGVTSLSVPVTVLAQASLPASETFGLDLATPTNATLATASASATITSAAPNPTSSVPSVVVSAGSAIVGSSGTATLPFTVTLSSASTSTVTVDYTTADSSAVAGTGTGFTDSWAQSTDSATTWFAPNSSPTQMSVTATPGS